MDFPFNVGDLSRIFHIFLVMFMSTLPHSAVHHGPWPLLFLKSVISLCWHTDSVELPGNSPSCPTEYDCVLFRELLDSVFFCGIYRDFGHLGWWTIEYIWGIHYLYTLLSAFVRHVVFIWLFIYFVLTGSSCSKGLKCSCDARLE